jgi:hypothetical protein
VRRRLLVAAGFATGALAATAASRRRRGGRRERLEVYFDDGSFVTFGSRSEEGARLLPLARQVAAAARRLA